MMPVSKRPFFAVVLVAAAWAVGFVIPLLVTKFIEDNLIRHLMTYFCLFEKSSECGIQLGTDQALSLALWLGVLLQFVIGGFATASVVRMALPMLSWKKMCVIAIAWPASLVISMLVINAIVSINGPLLIQLTGDSYSATSRYLIMLGIGAGTGGTITPLALHSLPAASRPMALPSIAASWLLGGLVAGAMVTYLPPVVSLLIDNQCLQSFRANNSLFCKYYIMRAPLQYLSWSVAGLIMGLIGGIPMIKRLSMTTSNSLQ